MTITKSRPRAHATSTLRESIARGVYAAGELLPSEMALQAELGVSRRTVRVALEELVSGGILRKANGRGHMVAATGESALAQAFVLLTSMRDDPQQHIRRGLAAIDSGVYDGAGESGWSLLVVHGGLRTATLANLLQHRPLAVAITEVAAEHTAPAERLIPLFDSGIPIAVAGNQPVWARVDRVISDHRAGSLALTRWLLGRGCRRILRFWTEAQPDSYWLIDRNLGYEDALREAGLDALPPLHTNTVASTLPDADRARFYAGYLAEQFKRGGAADAIMLANDVLYPPVAAACRLMGLEPGRDVLIAGYDNNWDRVRPPAGHPPEDRPVVTVDKREYEIGRELTTLLIGRLAGTVKGGPVLRTVAPEVVVL